MAKRPLFIHKRPSKGVIARVIEHWQFWLTSILAIIGTWLVINQNQLMENQNALIERQMSLDEASRRSALVMLMSNIMDKVDDEIKDQKDELRKEGISKTAVDTMKFSLSQSLIGQIAALSHSFKPYRFMQNDTLIVHPLSPERGQLLITLTLLPLDTNCLKNIFKSSSFLYADLGGANLSNRYLKGINLGGANLKRANLFNSNLVAAELEWVDMSQSLLERANLTDALIYLSNLKWAVLSEANLTNANLGFSNLGGANFGNSEMKGASLFGADLGQVNNDELNLGGVDNLDNAIGMYSENTNLVGAKNLTVVQLSAASRLFRTIMADTLQKELYKSNPELFKETKYNVFKRFTNKQE